MALSQEDKRERLRVAAIRRLRKLKLRDCFDHTDLESRPTDGQWEVLNDIGKIHYRYVLAGNQSGKTGLVARELSWILNDEHPTWTRPEEWKGQPMLVLIAAQNLKNARTNIWYGKLAPLLTGSWKFVEHNGAAQSARNLDNGDEILFLSHADSSEHNRIQMQGYVAHYVWLDEMPRSAAILEELQRRVDSRNGYWISSFTPKNPSLTVRRVVDAAQEPLAKRYYLSKLDNPLFSLNAENEIKKLEGYTEAQKNTILYGAWDVGEGSVYSFDEGVMVEDPDDYQTHWRHVESVDPALKSRMGWTLWAENPKTGVWYLIGDDYIDGILDSDGLVQECQRRTRGLNVVRRVSDTMPYFIGAAHKLGVKPPYITPNKANNRKAQLIKSLQDSLTSGKIRVAHKCSNFIDEIGTCRWSETGEDRIINPASYHTLDCAQYFVDRIPPGNVVVERKGRDQLLREAHTARKKAEKAKKDAKLKVISSRRRAWRRRR